MVFSEKRLESLEAWTVARYAIGDSSAAVHVDDLVAEVRRLRKVLARIDWLHTECRCKAPELLGKHGLEAYFDEIGSVAHAASTGDST